MAPDEVCFYIRVQEVGRMAYAAMVVKIGMTLSHSRFLLLAAYSRTFQIQFFRKEVSRVSFPLILKIFYTEDISSLRGSVKLNVRGSGFDILE